MTSAQDAHVPADEPTTNENGSTRERPPLPPDLDIPSNPMALVVGQKRLTELFDLMDRLKGDFGQSREMSLAMTRLEEGALWLRQAVYLEGYKGVDLKNDGTQAQKNNL